MEKYQYKYIISLLLGILGSILFVLLKSFPLSGLFAFLSGVFAHSSDRDRQLLTNPKN